MLNQQFLMRLRSIIIELLNTIDDELGLERTIPKKTVRRRIKRMQGPRVGMPHIVND